MELYDLLTLHYFLLFIVVKYTISSKNVPVNGPLWQKTHPLYPLLARWLFGLTPSWPKTPPCTIKNAPRGGVRFWGFRECKFAVTDPSAIKF